MKHFEITFFWKVPDVPTSTEFSKDKSQKFSDHHTHKIIQMDQEKICNEINEKYSNYFKYILK